jgi:hypothetical protein
MFVIVVPNAIKLITVLLIFFIPTKEDTSDSEPAKLSHLVAPITGFLPGSERNKKNKISVKLY